MTIIITMVINDNNHKDDSTMILNSIDTTIFINVENKIIIMLQQLP